MSKSSDEKNISSLNARIQALQENNTPNDTGPSQVGHMHIAWRMVIDLVAGVGIGSVLGYGLDRLFETLPLLMIIGTLLGLATGVNLMLRTAKEMNISQHSNKNGKIKPNEPYGKK